MDYRVHITREEDQKNNMNISKIYKIDNTKFFDNVERFEELNNALIDICKQVFTGAYNSGGKEAGAILNLRTLEYDFKKPKYFNKINFYDSDDECHRLIDASHSNECITIHTHNNVSTFSLIDLIALLSSDNTISMILVDSEANISLMTKNATIDYTKMTYEIKMKYSWTDIIYPEVYDMIKSEGVIYRRLQNES